MAELKTQKNDASVEACLDGVSNVKNVKIVTLS